MNVVIKVIYKINNVYYLRPIVFLTEMDHAIAKYATMDLLS